MAEPTQPERGPINLRIKFRSASLDQFIERYGVDVSRGGIFIRTREPLAVGTRIKFDFQLLEAGPLLAGEGTVVWIREHDPARTGVTPGMGVRFDKLSPESQPTLDKILAEKTRLQQGALVPGTLTKSGAGMAVRRPSGIFSATAGLGDPAATKAMTGNAESPSSSPSSTPSASSTSAATVGAGPSSVTPGAPARPSGIFSRPRTTTGMSAARSAPMPGALFEPPTADDIDKALAALEDKPGPVPAPPAPPRLDTSTPSRFTTRETAKTAMPAAEDHVPIAVQDDASNEPTRVGIDTAGEFSVHEAVTGRGEIIPESGAPVAPVTGEGELTNRVEDADLLSVEESLPTRVPTGNAPADGSPSASPSPAVLDAPVVNALDAAAAPVVIVNPGGREVPGVTESGRFRTTGPFKPIRKRRSAGPVIAALVVLAAAAGAAVYWKMRVHAPAPAPTPSATPGTASTPGAAPAEQGAQPAATGAPADKTAATTGGTDAAAAAQAATAPQAGEPPPAAPTAAPEPAKPAPESAKPAPEAKEEPTAGGGKRARRRARASAEEKATPQSAKPAEAAKPAAGETAPAPEAAAPAAAPTPAAEAPPAEVGPVLKVASTPAGAEVILDGNSIGTTPIADKSIDPAGTHTVTVKKDGFDTQQRMFGKGDWSKTAQGPSLKMNFKLKRTRGAAAPAGENAEPEKKEKPDVEVLTPE
jgi:uncharacterized protein (TIGR02266 family)